jgi:hypothetical protein
MIAAVEVEVTVFVRAIEPHPRVFHVTHPVQDGTMVQEIAGKYVEDSK